MNHKHGKTVCAVIVTYNRCALLRAAIQGLRKQTIEIGGIVVVNNASHDETESWLDSMDDLHVRHLHENTGGAGGFHEGMKMAAELGYEYFWLLDDDAVAEPGALEKLLQAHEHFNGNYGFLSSSVLSPDGDPMNVPVLSDRPGVTGYPDWPRNLAKAYLPVVNATFVSCFVPKKIVLEVGLPIKEMFIWGDDTEYTKRISAKHPCYMIGDSIVRHRRMQNANLDLVSEADPKRLGNYYYFYRNSVYNRKIYQRKGSPILSTSQYVVSTAFRIVKDAKSDKKLRLKVMLRGVKDGLMFRPRIDYVD